MNKFRGWAEVRTSNEPSFEELPDSYPAQPEVGSGCMPYFLMMLVGVGPAICVLITGLLWLLQEGPW